MDKSNVVEFAGRDGIVDPMTELLRTGAEQLIYQAGRANCRSYWPAYGATSVRWPGWSGS